jgi:hypothetical protein
MRIILALVTAALLALTAPAQPHTHGWLFTTDATGPLAAGRVDVHGSVTTLVLSSGLPASSYLAALVMDADNRTMVAALCLSGAPRALLHFDANGAIVRTTTVATSGQVNGVAVNPDGDYAVAMNGFPTAPYVGGLLCVSRTTGAVTTLRIGTASNPLYGLMNVQVDVESGDYLVMDYSHRIGWIRRISLDGANESTVVSLTFPNTYELGYHPRTGDYYVGCFTSNDLVSVSRTGGITTLATPAFRAHALHADRAGAPSSRLFLGSSQGGFHYLDLSTKVVTTLTAPTGRLLLHTAPDRGRNLASLRQAPGRWDILLSFPGEAGLGYALGVSLSGLRPGVTLPDGRHLTLNVDPFTALGLNGLLAPVLTGTAGTLDAMGAARATLDVSALSGVQGLRIWFLAATLDPSAPLGIRTISDPWVIVI